MGTHFSSLSQRKPARLSFMFLLLGLITILAACGSPSNAQSSTNASTTASCNKSTGLTLYSAQGYDSDAAKAFQQSTMGCHLV